ncbi:LDLR chaperone boca-like [Limulus polyphemus]|uniref:LDLR chaperone boca-like n=1 Tax=Limulus polyphemus TaxID=6850 RepID=A0ABM1BIE1_LIMPO|nr:LDLR chaperone boca-like [Limulus polyphemus]
MSHKKMDRNLSVLIVIILIFWGDFVIAKKSDKKEKPSWAKKDIRDYNDADLERLFDQWEEDEEPLEEDELPEHLRPSPKIDLSNLDTSNPENLLKISKKGRTLMTFVSVSGNPSQEELEEITKLWQTSLMNNHINAERFLIDDHRAIFMFKDGSQAWDAKDYLVNQERLDEITIENKPYYGKYSRKAKEETNNKSSDASKSSKEANSREKSTSINVETKKPNSDEL